MTSARLPPATQASPATSTTTTPRCWDRPPTGRSHSTPATGILPYHRYSILSLIITINQVPALQNINFFQNEADPTDFSRLINPVDDELVEGVSAVVAAEAKSKDDDLDLALDALRDCDTDFIKFDQVCT